MKQVFLIHPHIYFTKTTRGEILLYNTKNGRYIESESPLCLQLMEKIYKPENLGVIDLADIYLENEESQTLIQKLVQMDFGQIRKEKTDSPRLVNLLPILNLHDDVERLKQKEEYGIENSLFYLNELNIYLNGQCNLSCPHCILYAKQTKSCYKCNKNSYIQPAAIIKILDRLKYSRLLRVNIMGGNIFLYPALKELVEQLKTYRYNFHYWVHISNMENQLLNPKLHREILITFPIDKKLVIQYIAKNKSNNRIFYHFFIENEIQYAETESILNETNITNYEITPIYTKENIQFFEDHVYLGKEDIFAVPIPHRIIFCNQKLNSNHFGKLYILPDGSVKANMNTETLVHIDENSMLEMITKEMDYNTAWRVIRKESPCIDCLFQYLCPPPSNYETAIGKPNLCVMKP